MENPWRSNNYKHKAGLSKKIAKYRCATIIVTPRNSYEKYIPIDI